MVSEPLGHRPASLFTWPRWSINFNVAVPAFGDFVSRIIALLIITSFTLVPSDTILLDSFAILVSS